MKARTLRFVIMKLEGANSLHNPSADHRRWVTGAKKVKGPRYLVSSRSHSADSVRAVRPIHRGCTLALLRA